MKGSDYLLLMKIIITESQLSNLQLRRNIDELPKFIRSTYRWLNPLAFYGFDDFLDRVIFSTTRDFISNFMDEGSDYENLVADLQPVITEIIMNEHYGEILDYYNLSVNR